MSTELIVRPEEQAVKGLELAEQVFTEERRVAIARFLDVEATEPALPAYLAVCASYGLDPVMGQIWLIKQRGKNADGGDKLRPSVGRDGLLAIARRSKDFKGLQADVVHARDSFEVAWDGSMDGPQVLHRHASKPVEFADDENPRGYRGVIIGAWAKCYVEGRAPTFYFADIREHGRVKEGGWEGAWGYTHAMLLKAAQSYVLRIAMGITGVVPADELNVIPGSGSEHAFVEGEPIAEEQVPWGEDEDVAERLREAVRAANVAEPNAWPVAKCQMVFGGRTTEELAAAAEQIERENAVREENAEKARLRAEERAEQAEGEGKVTDAEVVHDEPTGQEDTPEVGERIEALRRRHEELSAAFDQAAPASDRAAEIGGEMEKVAREIRQLGGDVPGQG